ncbi:MAG: hypothetical protein R3336_08970, partial [Phycisphaeraceae bacterium]|nr:hypothetical protein [Phycisphaeraceae bacterium]
MRKPLIEGLGLLGAALVLIVLAGQGFGGYVLVPALLGPPGIGAGVALLLVAASSAVRWRNTEEAASLLLLGTVFLGGLAVLGWRMDAWGAMARYQAHWLPFTMIGVGAGA